MGHHQDPAARVHHGIGEPYGDQLRMSIEHGTALRACHACDRNVACPGCGEPLSDDELVYFDAPRSAWVCLNCFKKMHNG